MIFNDALRYHCKPDLLSRDLLAQTEIEQIKFHNKRSPSIKRLPLTRIAKHSNDLSTIAPKYYERLLTDDSLHQIGLRDDSKIINGITIAASELEGDSELELAAYENRPIINSSINS
jgi:hypothetical protein